MNKDIEILASPAEAANRELLKAVLTESAGWKDMTDFAIKKKSLDSRGRPVFRIKATVYRDEYPPITPALLENVPTRKTKKKVLIIGAGPAGYFAALQCILSGVTPIVLDRGKDVQSRRRDLREIQQFSRVNPDSNYCFGEGGAGTYSDGKLYTSSKKRGDINIVLRVLTECGANTDILTDAHPHIGSNKLPKVVERLREFIEAHGGEIHFQKKVVDFVVENHKIALTKTSDGDEYSADAVILATGHSARDIFYLLHSCKIALEAKSFALGVRVEHSQQLIDTIQYRQTPRDVNLPAASYKLVEHRDGMPVFSFCMCPGGLIVPSATAPGEIVVNGMSMSRRDSPFANSGIVVGIAPDDVGDFKRHGVFACLEFQKHIEQQVFSAGDGSQKAPAQRMADFAQNKISSTLPTTSYIPNIHSYDVASLFPVRIALALQKALPAFEKKMNGYFTNEAIVVAAESRTSSPVKIPRDSTTLQHIDIQNLYPCGEGAGYAGGIMSAALDGMNVARTIAQLWGCPISEYS